MKRWLLWSGFFLFSCGTPPDDEPAAPKAASTESDTVAASADTETIPVKDTASHAALAPTPEVKKPSGIYQFLLPYGSGKILHTVAFYANTFRLQEEYLNKPDSVVSTTGTWAPSQGGLWLYKEQLVRGRYFWQGDTLQYFSPRLNKRFSLAKLTPVSANPTWQEKKKADLFYGVGTEPFWSVEVSRQDSLVMNMPDWTEPLRVKITDAADDNGRRIYKSVTDSLEVTVLPYFCTDGMSDFIYPNKVVVSYKGRNYRGCGVAF